MKKIIKKIIAVLVVGAMVLANCFLISMAADETTISAADIRATPGEIVTIPVSITNNNGLMGLLLSFEFDMNALVPASVTKGKILKSGILNDSIGTDTGNKVDVIWTNTEDIINDGEILLLSFKVNQSVNESQVIKVSFSQQDTFNSKYEDVPLVLNDIQIQIDNSDESEPLTIWQRIVAFFKNIIRFFANMF